MLANDPMGIRDEGLAVLGRTQSVSDGVQITGEVIAILENQETGERRVHRTHNIVTNDGDQYFAEIAEIGFKGAGSPTNDFDTLYLGTTVSPTPAKADNFSNITNIGGGATQPTITSGYPQTSDPDTDNTGSGADILTYQYAYTAGSFSQTGITEGAIATSTATGTDPILCRFAFASSFDKGSSDTLKVIYNVTFNGT